MAKRVKIEKETRRLIEGISDLIKRKSNGTYKFKTKKKKEIRSIKRSCQHWKISKNKEHPTLIPDPNNKMNFKCTICGASLPIPPLDIEREYYPVINEVIEHINQMQFWSVKMGGDADCTKMFIRLKRDLLTLKKVEKNLMKSVNKRKLFEDRKNNTDSLSQFDSYTGFSYNG